jgi:cytochrome P450
VGDLPPGPKLPPVVQAFMWAYRYREFSEAQHDRFGPSYTARIGGLPPAVVTRDRTVIKRLLTGDPLGKRHANDLLREVLGDRSLLLLEPQEHLTRRKLLTPPFHGERVKGYARLMERLLASELDGWQPGSDVEVIKVAQRLTLDVILEAVLGVADREMRTRLRTLFDEMLALPVAEIFFYFPALQKRSKWNRGAEMYWRKRDRLDAILNEQIASTRADPRLEQREDILAMMIRARDEDGNALTDTDLCHELNTLISAGHETTATAISWAADLLAHNRHVQIDARAAIDGGDQRFLDALVKEILRIRAPVAVAAARHPLEPFEIPGGYSVGRDAVVIADAWGVHLDPSIYPDPDVLRPERFLEEAPEYGWLPFGGGVHRCLGAALAQLEIKVAVTGILSRFELLPTAGEPARPVRRGIVLAPKGGGRVRVAPAPAIRPAATEPVATI